MNTYERFKKYRKENIEYLKSVRPLRCEQCGYERCFAALDFHHLDKSQKNGPKDKLSAWLYGYSPSSFKRKIDSLSFIILCSNCHRELHHKEQNASYKEES